jgi:hypothetical protein
MPKRVQSQGDTLMDEEMFEEKSRPIIENILKAHVSKNYEQLTKVFCENSDVHIPKKEEFNEAVKEVVEPLGNFILFTYLGSVNKKDENLLLWKVSFEQGAEELLWHLYFSDEMKITAIWFG